MSQQSESKTGQYMALTAALLGWLFDGFEIGLFPLIGKPALKELLGNSLAGVGTALTPEQTKIVADAVNSWFGVIIAVFLVGAATGGVFFGWLGDRIGRVRAMSLSILAYALFTGMCGLADQAWQIAAFRFLAALGMGGEWSLGVALVNEIWPGKSRAFIAGLIGAAANVGFALVALMSLGMTSVVSTIRSVLLTVGLPEDFAGKLLANEGWRFLMISGALPALLVFFVRVFVPESKKWEEEKEKGSTGFWNNTDLYGVLAGCLGAMMVIYVWTPNVTNLAIRLGATVCGLVIALLGYLFPVRQFLSRATAGGKLQPEVTGTVLRRMLFGAGLAGVALLGTWGSVQWAPNWAGDLAKAAELNVNARAWTQFWSAIGAVLGTIIAAMSADRFGRRMTYAVICVGSMLACMSMYQFNTTFDAKFQFFTLVMGGTTAAMYGFFPLYFPELFPTSVRATGQGFCFNFGRVIAAVGGLQTATLIAWFDGSFPKAGTAMSVIYLVGAVLIWFGPETKGKALPE